jgi:hypothetical protein
MTKKALRLNTNKPKLSYILLFPHVLQALARIMEFGGIKYEDGNWKLGGKPDQEYQDSGMRHLTKWINGEKFDEDSGCSHLGHAIWNFMALLELNHPDEIIDEKVFKEQCEYWTAKKAEKAEEEEVPSCLGCEFDQCRVDEPCRKEVTEPEIKFELKDKPRTSSFQKLFMAYLNPPKTLPDLCARCITVECLSEQPCPYIKKPWGEHTQDDVDRICAAMNAAAKASYASIEQISEALMGDPPRTVNTEDTAKMTEQAIASMSATGPDLGNGPPTIVVPPGILVTNGVDDTTEYEPVPSVHSGEDGAFPENLDSVAQRGED